MRGTLFWAAASLVAVSVVLIWPGPITGLSQEPGACWDCMLRACPGIGQTPAGNVIDWRCNMQQWTSTYCCESMRVRNPQAWCLGARPCAAECLWTDEFGVPQRSCIPCGSCFELEE